MIGPFILNAQQIEKLDNGLTFISLQNNKVPLATFQIWIKAGSIYETDYPGSGISHFVEHLLFTDTKKYTGIEIAKFMKEQGCDMNGYTSFEQTVYHFTLPSENLRKIIPYVKEMVFEPAFKNEQIEKERNVILKEINMNVDDPNRYFSNLIFSSSYNQSLFQYPIIGLADLFKKINKNDLLQYYKSHYVPDNMAIVLVGDFNNDVKNLIIKEFSSLDRQFFKTPALIDEPEQMHDKVIIQYRNDIQLPRMAMTWKTIDIRHKDLFALDLLAMMLSSGYNSILNRVLKEKLQYVNSIDASSYTPIKKGVFIIDAELNPGIKIEQVKNEILSILKTINKYITMEELNKIKLVALKNYYAGKETINSQAADLGINWISTDDIYFSKYYTEGLRAVSKNDILNVVKKYFYKDNLTLIGLLPEKEKKTSSQEAKSGEKDIVQTDVLNNKIKLIINQNNTIPFINISFIWKAGPLFEPNAKKGISLLLSKMLLSETKKYTKEKLINQIEDKGGSIEPFAGNNSFGLSMQIFKENFQDTLKIVNEIIKNLAFNKNDMEKYRLEILQQIKQTREQIFGLGKKVLFKQMYPNYDYAYLNTGTETSIQNITIDDLKQYYKKIITPANTVISISGDLDLDQAKKIVQNNFKDWSGKSTELEEKPFTPHPLNTKELMEPIDKEQSLIFVAYYGISVRDENRLKADLLWNFLNGQGSGLFTNLREKKELAYYTGLFPFYGLTTGLFVFYVGTIQSKIELAKQGLNEEISRLIKNGMSQNELESSKKEFMADKMKSFQANSGMASEYGLEYLYNNRILNVKDYQIAINQIDVKQMNEFIKKYFGQAGKWIILKGK